MVAKIITGKSIRGMLLYNENKVLQGEANLILSSGFATDIHMLNFYQKLQRFQHLTELKPNVKTNAVHISLNFHDSENLDNATLQQIASTYMERIGFRDQPYLVYRHEDSAHQHLHITTTNITSDGERMNLHNIGKRMSEPARKELEIEYGLIKAEEQKNVGQAIKPVDLEKVKYGKIPTKQAIRNVVTAVTRDYRFTSLAEYNAALNCFGVTASRGAEHTQMFKRNGLMFSMMDKSGAPIGVPIKASALPNRPTLKNLEAKFLKNLERRKVGKEDLIARLDELFNKGTTADQKSLKKAAKKSGIDISFRQNEQGILYGITYIDHKNMVVFNGSDLRKAYTAKGVTERMTANQNVVPNLPPSIGKTAKDQMGKTIEDHPAHNQSKNLLEIALAKTQADAQIAIPKRKRKRKKIQTVHQEINL